MKKNTEVKERINRKIKELSLEKLTTEELTLLENLLTNLASYFHSKKSFTINEESEKSREELIYSLQGKYAHAATSSEEFARQKQKEIDSEECN